MKHGSAGRHYVAYILRCWQEEQAAADLQSPWRFSLEEIGADYVRIGFSQLEDIFVFLQESLSESPEVGK